MWQADPTVHGSSEPGRQVYGRVMHFHKHIYLRSLGDSLIYGRMGDAASGTPIAWDCCQSVHSHSVEVGRV